MYYSSQSECHLMSLVVVNKTLDVIKLPHSGVVRWFVEIHCVANKISIMESAQVTRDSVALWAAGCVAAENETWPPRALWASIVKRTGNANGIRAERRADSGDQPMDPWGGQGAWGESQSSGSILMQFLNTLWTTELLFILCSLAKESRNRDRGCSCF